MTINSDQKSSKSELSSGIFGHFKVWKKSWPPLYDEGALISRRVLDNPVGFRVGGGGDGTLLCPVGPYDYQGTKSTLGSLESTYLD